MPFLSDILVNILARGYIIAYMPVLAEFWSVLPAVSVAEKSVQKTFNPSQNGESSSSNHPPLLQWQRQQTVPAGQPPPHVFDWKVLL
jgi:hypothetical protein